MNKTIEAVMDKVAVIIIEEEKKTSSGIIIPATVSNEPQGYGVVVSVGPEVKTIKVNDIVIFNKRAGQDIMLNQKVIKIMFDKEIYGIVKDVEE